MNIPEEAVEAASRAQDPGTWEFLDLHHTDRAGTNRIRHAALARAREILEAAAPFIAAQALREAADETLWTGGLWLRDRADRIESPDA